MKALLVEDSPGMRKIISIMLKSMGYNQIIAARHGGEALDYLSTLGVDVRCSAGAAHWQNGACERAAKELAERFPETLARVARALSRKPRGAHQQE